MDVVPWKRFETCVTRYLGDYKVKEFSCAEHFRVMAFAQLTYRESLRDIEACLKAIGTRRYHMGIRCNVSRNNLAHANETRDWRIYADFAQILIARAKALYANEPFALELADTVYALDSTTIDLCMNMFPWARFRKTKSAIKVHTLLNLRGSIPEFICISDGKLHDVKILDLLIPVPGAFYITWIGPIWTFDGSTACIKSGHFLLPEPRAILNRNAATHMRLTNLPAYSVIKQSC